MADKKEALNEKELGLKTKLSILVESYNEHLILVVKLQLDLDYFQYLEIAEPGDTTHGENRRNVEKALKLRTKYLSIVTSRILNLGKEEDEQKNGS